MSNRFVIDAQAGSVKIDGAVGASKTSEYGSMSGGSFEFNVESETVNIHGEQVAAGLPVMNSTASMLYISNSFYPNVIDGSWSTVSEMPWHTSISSKENTQAFMSASLKLNEYCRQLPDYNKIERVYPRLAQYHDGILMSNGKVLLSNTNDFAIYDPYTNEITIANIKNHINSIVSTTGISRYWSYRMIEIDTGEIYTHAYDRMLYNSSSDRTDFVPSFTNTQTSNHISERLFSLGGNLALRYAPAPSASAYRKAVYFDVTGVSTETDLPNFPISTSETWPDAIRLSDGLIFFGPRSGYPYGVMYNHATTTYTNTSTIQNNAPASWRALAELPNGDVFVAPGDDSLYALIWRRATDTWTVASISNFGANQCFTFGTTKVFCIKSSQSTGEFAQIYDVETDTWTQGPSQLLSGDRDFYVKLPNGKILMNPSSEITGAPIYDPASNTYTIVGAWPLNSATGIETICLDDGKIAVANNGLAQFFIRDMENNSNRVVSTPGGLPVMGRPLQLKDGRIAFLTYNNSNVQIMIYNRVADTWWTSNIDTHALGQGYSDSNRMYLMPDGRILIPRDNGTTSATALFKIFDPVTGLWTHKEHSSPHTSRCKDCVILNNGKILFNTNISSANLIYDPATDVVSFTSGTSLVNVTSTSGYRDMTLLSDGRVISTSNDATPVYIYSPLTNAWDTQLFSVALDETILLEDGTLLGLRRASGTYQAHSVQRVVIINVEKQTVEELNDGFGEGSMTRMADGGVLITSVYGSAWAIFRRKNIKLPANWSLSPLFK